MKKEVWTTLVYVGSAPKALWPFLPVQSDYPYNENVPSIKIPMDMMEQEPFLGDKASDSE